MQTRTSAAMIYCRVKLEEAPKHGRDGPEEEAVEMGGGWWGAGVNAIGTEKYESRELINPPPIHPSIFC